MDILFITRLYSGFEFSLEKLDWKPEGVPTIYNLINKLSKMHNISIIFTAKDSGKTYTSKWKKRNDISLKLKGLRANIYALSGIYYFPKFIPKKIAMIFRDFRQLLVVIKYIRKNNTDLIYCDSANVVIAYILTKLFPKKKVVVRVLGVCSFWRAILSSNRLVHRIYKYSFKGSFSCVIGTQDGSGIEYWFKEVLKKNVSRHVLLNGVDANKNIKKNITVHKRILFVGRLESYKGIIVFIKAMIKILKKDNFHLTIFIIGDGSLYSDAVGLCKEAGVLKHFKFLKSIPHSEVLKYHSNSDIYVSANTDGNLINTNLEAISSDACMIIPKQQKNKLIDIKTMELLKNAVTYYKVNDIDDLKNKTSFLLNSPKEIMLFKNKIAKTKKKFIKTWMQRVDEEVKILEDIVRK